MSGGRWYVYLGFGPFPVIRFVFARLLCSQAPPPSCFCPDRSCVSTVAPRAWFRLPGRHRFARPADAAAWVRDGPASPVISPRYPSAAAPAVRGPLVPLHLPCRPVVGVNLRAPRPRFPPEAAPGSIRLLVKSNFLWF